MVHIPHLSTTLMMETTWHKVLQSMWSWGCSNHYSMSVIFAVFLFPLFVRGGGGGGDEGQYIILFWGGGGEVKGNG